MPYGISPTLLYGGLVFGGGFLIGYWLDTDLQKLLASTWMVALFTGFGALGAYVLLQKEVITSLPNVV